MMKKETRIIVYNKFQCHCAYCGKEIKYKDMQVDHVIPAAKFVLRIRNKNRVPVFLEHLTESNCNNIDNLFPACRICNKWKGTFGLETFRDELSRQVERCEKTSSNFRMALKYNQVIKNEKKIVFYFEICGL